MELINRLFVVVQRQVPLGWRETGVKDRLYAIIVVDYMNFDASHRLDSFRSNDNFNFTIVALPSVGTRRFSRS